LIHPVGMRSGAHSTPVVTLTRPLDSPWRQHGAMVRGESGGWLIVDSRVVMDQAWLHRLLLRAFHRGRDRGGICGKSHFISSASVLYRVGKTPASNMSLRQTARRHLQPAGAKSHQVLLCPRTSCRCSVPQM